MPGGPIRGYRGPMRERNQVTPDHVGRRVTFQYELPNGFVSEVVGTLESYDEAATTYVVKTRDGDLVRVPHRGVRHGKPVS